MIDLMFMSDVEKIALEIRKMLDLPLSVNFDDMKDFSNPELSEMIKKIRNLDIEVSTDNFLRSYCMNEEILLSIYESSEDRMWHLVLFAVQILIKRVNNSYDSDVVEKISKAVLMPKDIYNQSLIIYSCNAGGNIYPEKIAKQFKVSSGLVVGRGIDLGVIA